MGAKLTLKDMNLRAKKHDGLCLSKQYKKSHSKLKWECKNGHTFYATPASVQQEHWCPTCAGCARNTIENLERLARSKGGECLSKQYQNAISKLKWRCDKGHMWMAMPMHITRGHWCPKCGFLRAANLKRSGISEMQEIAESRGGICLSKKYENSNSKLEWRCSCGHVWITMARNVKRGSWCPKCTGIVPFTIDDMQRAARKRGGLCLSDRLLNGGHSLLKWRCAKGHVWNTKAANVRSGHWCPKCAIIRGADLRRTPISEMQELARAKGGVCLSKKYKNSKTKLKWKCDKGHIWMTYPPDIKEGHWCQVCGGSSRKNIKDMQLLAKKKGGICLSTQYVNTKSKLKWQCRKGHIWETPAGNVMSGTWCPYCRWFVSEKICRAFFEKFLNNKFPKSRPSWLLSSNGIRLELDGYSEKLKLAFEFQGPQHYKNYPKYYHSKVNLNHIKKNDARKRILCKRNNVKLIVVPWQKNLSTLNQVIIAELSKAQILIPSNLLNLSLEDIDVSGQDEIYLFKEIARNHGGLCISEEYYNCDTKMEFQCKYKHRWLALPRHVKAGSWCPYCVGNTPKNIVDMQSLAEKNNGLCISKIYNGSEHKLKWQCRQKHIFEMTPSGVNSGRWCPQCAGNAPKNIKDMQFLAKKRNGLCLSKRYRGSHIKLRWQCSKEHVFYAVPFSIQQGSWCPICGRVGHNNKQKFTILDMNKLAASKEGVCLSRNYINTHTYLKWRCKFGHVWQATPHNIKRRTWCPECARLKRYQHI